jgi:hypothetical protein
MNPVTTRRPLRTAPLALAALAAASDLAAQVEWTKPVLEGRIRSGFVYDSARGVCVLYGGWNHYQPTDTWTWNGLVWHRRAPQPGGSPPPMSVAMAFDAARSRTVLFGGMYPYTQTSNETWEYDGTAWTRLQPSIAPPARWGATMTYDPVRGRIVLFGGMLPRNIGVYRDTWEWDGTRWVQMHPTTSPPARQTAAMTYDTVRREALLFGGADAVGALVPDDLWGWNGSDWRRVSAPSRPGPRSDHALAFDSIRGRAVLYGGNGTATDTWEWDGAAWYQIQPAHDPGTRFGHSMAFDPLRGHTLLLGGGGGPRSDLWAWDGSDWRRLTPSAPRRRRDPAIAADPTASTLLMFGGSNGDDTWSWSGTAWTELQPAVQPPAREGHAMVTDLTRARIVLFGGGSGWPPSTAMQDHWEWSGSTWSQRTPAALPPARSYHGMAYDALRDRIVLFGGESTTGASLADTWEFDGATWAQRTPSHSPTARERPSMAFDIQRGRTVVYGGAAGRYDTWEWDGNDWTQHALATSPQVASARLVYDAERSRCVLVGTDVATNLMGAWEWDGGSWTARTNSERPAQREQFALCYDPWRARSVLFGSTTDGNDTWEYGPTHAASLTSFGVGCAGSSGAPSLSARPLPWLGDTLTIEASNLAAGPAVVLLGPSDTVWSGTPLPFDLGPLGMPGCQLLVDPEVLLPLAVAAGTGTFRLPVVPDPGLLGLTLYAQALSIDPPANPFGAAVSDGLRITIGGR